MFVSSNNNKKLTMTKADKPIITVEAIINATTEKIWQYWTLPEHITQWCQASPDWHAPYAENDLWVGGKFKTTMAAKDGSFSFDFGGVYTNVKENSRIDYTMDDGRRVEIEFAGEGGSTKITETFEAESENSLELQQGGWQAILNSFKQYAESN
jgi:uncharacterized protein YndB with AHSA1/START domain